MRFAAMGLKMGFTRHLLGVFLLSLTWSTVQGAVISSDDSISPDHKPTTQNPIHPVADPLPINQAPISLPQTPIFTTTTTSALQNLHSALSTLQSTYFTLWLGKWTTAIDWTAAVTGTHVSAALSTLSNSLTYTLPGTFRKDVKLDVEAQMVENEINRYFAHSSAFFFGEDHFAVRNQAYDDMLWVVLGWLDGIKFVRGHSGRHYEGEEEEEEGGREDEGWHGKQFIPAFAHRARVFWELASRGWDERLCGGGMTWNPRLLPYKNAITNQLWIAASVEMYLYFPGDENCSPFMTSSQSTTTTNNNNNDDMAGQANACSSTTPTSHNPTYDPTYLHSAISGYSWLRTSHMLNSQGLYTDGFHIRDYAHNHSKTHCDDRNEMIYTYNQGVILSGLRGLWEATGNITYLEDGHELIRNVIRATGYTDTPISAMSFSTPPHSSPPSSSQHTEGGGKVEQGSWAGLGTSGILTELCDPFGTCSQDSQTFKGIFFHHFTSFCTPLPTVPTSPGHTHAASKIVARLHGKSCGEYTPWVVKNGNAALGNRDERGRFGGWWGVGHASSSSPSLLNEEDVRIEGAVDYKNTRGFGEEFDVYTAPGDTGITGEEEARVGRMQNRGRMAGDPNERGRGRTVETQGGGVAVVRAMWEFLRNFDL